MAAAAFIAALPIAVEGTVLALSVVQAVIPIISQGYELYINSKTRKVEKVKTPEGTELIVTADDKLIDQNGHEVPPTTTKSVIDAIANLTSPDMIQRIKDKITDLGKSMYNVLDSAMQYKNTYLRRKGGCEGKSYTWACIVVALVAVVLIVLIYQLTISEPFRAILCAGVAVIAVGHIGVLYCLKPACQCDKK